jgi:thioredoxin
MKKIVITTLLALLALSACNAQDKKESKIENNNKNEKTMTTVHLTKAMFLEKVANYEASPNEWKYLGDVPCIIDFYADWCGPCKAVAPVLEELAAEYGDKLVIYKVNTEEEQELSAAFGIRSIPTLLFCPVEGKPQMAQGALPKASFKEAIKDVLKVE